MSILYNERVPLRDPRIVYLGPRMQSYGGLGKIAAIRVYDYTRNIWYSWDSGSSWNNGGGTGRNAPVGETPRCTNGGQFYIAIYVTNTSATGLIAGAIYVDGELVINDGRTVNAGEGIQVVMPYRNMPAAGNVHIKIYGGPQSPNDEVEFDILGLGGGPIPGPEIPTAVIVAGAVGAVLIIGGVAYALSGRNKR
jgi:hypothetical protein